MSSGEADGYTVLVKGQDTPLINYGINSSSWSSSWGNNTGDYYTVPNTYYYWYPTSHYYYQILCPKPRCKTYNWCELDQSVTCRKCGSVLRAVSKTVDYEIPVK